MDITENGLNLTFRFILEMALLFSLSYWGWTQFSGIWRWIMSLVVPLIASLFWGTFRVNGDPGKARVAVPGIIRLLLELWLFSIGIWALFDAGQPTFGMIFLMLIVIHYLLSYKRVRWLIKQ